MAKDPATVVTRDFNPGKARWCETHQRMECTRKRNKGDGLPCHRSAIRGLEHCDWHSGLTKEVAMAKGEAMITAWSALGEPVIDHKLAVLGVLNMTWLRLQVYSEALREQVERDGIDQAEYDRMIGAGDPAASGLIGYRFGAAGQDGTLYVQGEDIRALVKLEAEERDRVVKYAEAAQRMGISDRMIALAERWGDIAAARVLLMLEELELTPDQQARAPELIRRHLSSIDMTIEGTAVDA